MFQFRMANSEEFYGELNMFQFKTVNSGAELVSIQNGQLWRI